MRIDLVFIPVILAVAAASMALVKPVEYVKTDLSALYIYWPEAYRYAERGDPSAVYRATSLVACATNSTIEAPPGLAHRAAGLICRFKP